ncbi:MAG: hypothetical protein ACREQA_11070 [Candidatus Binatia bacterium]
MTVIQQGERFAASYTEKEDKTAVGSGFYAIVFLGLKLALSVRDQHVRLHADGKDTKLPGNPFHRTPNGNSGVPAARKNRSWDE